MSYTSFAVYMQIRGTDPFDPTGDCDDYPRPDHLAAALNLNKPRAQYSHLSNSLNLCGEMS